MSKLTTLNISQEFIVKPCDIVFTRGSTFFSKLIRFNQNTWSDDHHSLINHTGVVVEEGPLKTADIIEALWKVKKHSIYDQYHNSSDKVAIFRPIDLTDIEKNLIVNKALSYEGRTYGYGKILTHSLDYFTGGRYIFRRLTNSDNYPICSWVVAHSYKSANKNFGCDPGMANPDNIWDYCEEHPSKYKYVFKLQYV